MEQKFSGMEGVVEVKNPLIPQETPPQEPDFQAIHDAVAVEPQSARYDRETGEVTGHVVGVDFDVEALKAAYGQAGEGETFSIPVTLTQPEETKQSLEAKLFRDGFFAEFDESELTRGDTKTRGEFYRIARGSMQEPGFMTTNEIRAAEGLPPIDGGDELQLSLIHI